jgi:aminoglycoside phosphotransferase (APT) family kinase protein
VAELPLLASGRDSDIYAIGSDRGLRRSRHGRSMAYEAKVMEFVRSKGYPAPEVFEVSDDGLDIVMARVDGTTMVEAAARRPWLLGRFGAQLGDLHTTLHSIEAPGWLHAAPVGTGDRIVHLDLHPLNVLVSSEGPVVIDWTGAARGDPAVDAAVTWILLASGEVPAHGLRGLTVRFGRSVLVRTFLKTIDLDAVQRVCSDVVDWKCQDTNMSDVERARMRNLVSGDPR